MARRVLAGALGAGAALSVACMDLVAPPTPTADRTAIFDQVWREFDRHYSLFEVTGVDWRAIGDHYRPLALGSDAQLRGALCDMLDTLKDLHVTLYAHVGPCGQAPRRTDSYDPNAIMDQSYLGGSVDAGASLQLTFGVLAPDVGYLRISGFTDTRLPADVDRALEELAFTRAMIIDLRLNLGGSSLIAEDIAGRFVDRRQVYVVARFRNGPAHTDFGDPIARRVGPTGDRHFGGPVALVINRTVGSAAEDFVMAMLTRPDVVLVGDTTSGTATDPLWRDLPNGWTFRLSQSIESTPGGLAPSLVGGIPPMIFARTSSADSTARIDTPVDSALAWLRR